MALGLSGCDLVWGVTGEPPACDLGENAFDATDREDIDIAVVGFGVAVDNNRVIATNELGTFELELDVNDAPIPVVLGGDAFMHRSLGLAPEGDFLFFADSAEPPNFGIANRIADQWVVSSQRPPNGERAGTPTAQVFGARRVLVNLGREGIVDDGTPARTTQEYVEDGDTWRPVGPRQALAFDRTNLTPNGMTAVFVEADVEGIPVVVIARRDHAADAFSDRTVIFHGEPGDEIRSAQLRGSDSLDKGCNTLFVDVGSQLRRYDR